MTLDRNSWIVRWAYLYKDRGDIPARTSLCPLFWRTVFLTPFIKIALPASVLGFLLSRFWFYPKESFRFIGVVIALGVAVALAAWVNDTVVRHRREREYRTEEPSVIRDGFRAIKSKVCPFVEIK